MRQTLKIGALVAGLALAGFGFNEAGKVGREIRYLESQPILSRIASADRESELSLVKPFALYAGVAGAVTAFGAAYGMAYKRKEE